MPKKERRSSVSVPEWWIDRAFTLIDEAKDTLDVIAQRASVAAQRKNPWGGDAISKYRQGVGRTVDLTNALSAALGIVRPFFTAPTESAATIIAEIVRNEQQHLDEKTPKFTVADERVVKEIRSSLVDASSAHGVGSSDHGQPRGDGVGTGSVRRRRP